jgi:two-component system nitrate/nitrite response regulator NarL
MNLQLWKKFESSPTIEAEINMLFRRLLDLLVNWTVPQRITYGVSVQNDHVEEHLVQEEVMLQFEHAGAYYKLVKCRPAPCGRATLSPREQEIVGLVSTGHPNKTIARKLAISQHTVNTHVRRIFGKLGVNSRAEMVAYALQSGLVAHRGHYN